MSRQVPSSAISAAALQTAMAPARVKVAGGLVGEAGSHDALTRLTAAMSELREMAIQPMLQRAVSALEVDDFRTGGEWAIKALDKDERSGFAWYLLGIARERAGDFASSVSAYDAALKLLPDHAEVANNLGRLAYRMGMFEQSEKLFRHFLAKHPGHPEGANNLSCVLRELNRAPEATEVLRSAIEQNPEYPVLWNGMGTVVADQGDFATAKIFFEEALRLDPIFPKARYNHGNALLALGDSAAALEACDGAIALVTGEDDRQMMRLARSTILLTLGRVGEGWDEYEARLHPQYAGVTQFAFDRPQWQPGDDLAGKSLLVFGEQGLGDEILFANTLPDVIDRLGPDGHLTIAVEKRLVPLFQRSFPQATVGAHQTYVYESRFIRVAPFVTEADGVDLWTPIASLLREFRRSAEDFPTSGALMTPDPVRVAHWRKVLGEAPQGPKIGLLWKSAIQKDSRLRYYSPFEAWTPVLTQPGAVFVNLQYGDCSEELAFVKRELDIEIWTPPGIDLKQDLDDLAALCAAMDLVVGFSNATLNIAAAVGAPTLLVSTPDSWCRLGGGSAYPWYPNTQVFVPPAFREWGPAIEQVAEGVAEFIASAER